MGLESAETMLKKARKEHYAIGQFNINNLEWTKAILTAAETKRSPVILGVSEGAAKYMTGFDTVVGMVKGMIKNLGITVPVAIHLDHGSYEGAHAAIDAGFSSVMFDGSHLPISENVVKTKNVVHYAQQKGVSTEGEVGSIGGEEDGITGSGEVADPEECRMLAKTGITMLAAGIGNIHGQYPENWKGLDMKVLKEIGETTDTIPLVLHGGTGIPDQMVREAITYGVSKINVNTECQLVFAQATRRYIEDEKDRQGKGFDPRKLLKPGYEAIINVVNEKIDLFGSTGKA